MSQQNSNDLVRLIVRLPAPVHAALRAHADATAVPMSAIIRQLVIRWVHDRRREEQAFPAVLAADEGDPQLNRGATGAGRTCS